MAMAAQRARELIRSLLQRRAMSRRLQVYARCMLRTAMIFCLALSAGAAVGQTIERYDGLCDASAAVALDARHFVVAGDEDNTLRIFERDQPQARATVAARRVPPHRQGRGRPRGRHAHRRAHLLDRLAQPRRQGPARTAARPVLRHRHRPQPHAADRAARGHRAGEAARRAAGQRRRPRLATGRGRAQGARGGWAVSTSRA